MRVSAPSLVHVKNITADVMTEKSAHHSRSFYLRAYRKCLIMQLKKIKHRPIILNAAHPKLQDKNTVIEVILSNMFEHTANDWAPPTLCV